MVLKLRKSVSRLYDDGDKENEKRRYKKSSSKVEAIYVVLTCFATHCLSSIALEAGGRSSLRNTVTKSAAFNALFRRTYNLKILILVTNVITGLITTIMMALGDRYGVPYLYLPWLVNTMKGMILCEGPALLSLANMLLPNVTFPSGSFILTTLLLYVEELCIWNDAFANFQGCWRNYHRRKQYSVTKYKEKLFTERNKELLRQGSVKNNLDVALEEPRTERSSIKVYDKTDDQISVESNVKPAKSTIEGKTNSILNQMIDITG